MRGPSITKPANIPIAMIATLLAWALVSTAAVAGTVTVSSPGSADKVRRGNTAISAPDKEGRICAACHDLHHGTANEFVSQQRQNTANGKAYQLRASGRSTCDYKKIPQFNKVGKP